jgi:hypothetical protein
MKVKQLNLPLQLAASLIILLKAHLLLLEWTPVYAIVAGIAIMCILPFAFTARRKVIRWPIAAFLDIVTAAILPL